MGAFSPATRFHPHTQTQASLGMGLRGGLVGVPHSAQGKASACSARSETRAGRVRTAHSLIPYRLREWVRTTGKLGSSSLGLGVCRAKRSLIDSGSKCLCTQRVSEFRNQVKWFLRMQPKDSDSAASGERDGAAAKVQAV